MKDEEALIPKHGSYRKLKSFQVAQLVYDVTVRFCDKYVDRFSRTKDQMVQAARSGVQNIAEGSLASATSKKTELKLTQVARASLEELKLDYEDFLRHRELPILKPEDPVLMLFKKKRCSTLLEVRQWVATEIARTNKDKQGQIEINNKTSGNQQSMSVSESPCQSFAPETLVANAALSLLNLACYLLDRQVATLAKDFEENGGFTERLYRVRSAKRRNQL